MARSNEIDWSKAPGVEIDPARQGGSPVFAGTRLPLYVVTDNLRNGGTPAEVAQILENFDVTKEQVDLVLPELRRHARRSLAGARP